VSVSPIKHGGALAAAALLLAGCNGLSQGTSSGPVTGAAAGSTSVNAVDSLQRCSEPLGTLAVDDGRNQYWWGPFYGRTQVTSIEPMVRLVVQQSNCFVITSLGNQRMEGRISGITQYQRNSGEFRAGSNQQMGQRVAADYYLEPAILFAGDTTSGLAGGLGGLGGLAGGRWGGLAAGALGGALRSNSTNVTMSLVDIRSGVQVAASEGSSTATNLGASLAGLGVGGGAAVGAGMGGFTRTPQGQATVAAFVDAYNKLVVATRNYRAQSVRGGSGTGGLLRVN
jgi:curli biogenesis system outer membrane secretion channel CsgG